SPDGALNLIPFESMVDENNQFLVENYSISYLTSGRDLLRQQAAERNKKTAVIFADPDFDKTSRRAEAGSKQRIAQRTKLSEKQMTSTTSQVIARFGPKLGGVQLKPLETLPGSAKEGKELKVLLLSATVLMKAQATETALKKVSRPSILHISTHGGFLED